VARFRRIVHPTDFSPASRPAFRKALALAKENRAALLLLHVLPAIPIVADEYISANAYVEMLRGHRAQGQKQVERLVRRVKAAGVRATGTVLEFGGIAEQIARFAKRQRADLILMGTHGHGILARVLLGSVAERVLSRAPCPVMTVRARG
jgi:nucleotide-binding universal stress UspA family protein